MKRWVLYRVLVLFIVLGAGWGERTPVTALQPRGAAAGGPAACGSGVPTASSWEIEWVETSKTIYDMRDNSLALDANGHPHVAYGGDHLYYAACDGAAWTTQTVDSSADVGRYASLALDRFGLPHVAYLDSPMDDLKYAQFDGLAWQVEGVEQTGSVGLYVSLALNPAGQGALCYQDRSRGELKCARQTCVPASGARIAGPRTLGTGETGVYTGTALPPTASPTVTLGWDGGAWGPTAAYSWTAPGSYTVAFTATNACGSAQAVFEVLVCRSLEGLTIAGPVSLVPGETGVYTATYLPVGATFPVTVTWDNGTVGATAVYSWTMPGTYTLTATAVGPCNQVRGIRTVEVRARAYRFYLAVVLVGR